MAQKKAQEWSNVPNDMDEEMKTPTPRELQLADLAEKNKDASPQRYNITSKKTKGLRVLYDYNGKSVAIRPEQTKLGILLLPSIVEQLGRNGDLEFTASA